MPVSNIPATLAHGSWLVGAARLINPVSNPITGAQFHGCRQLTGATTVPTIDPFRSPCLIIPFPIRQRQHEPSLSFEISLGETSRGGLPRDFRNFLPVSSVKARIVSPRLHPFPICDVQVQRSANSRAHVLQKRARYRLPSQYFHRKYRMNQRNLRARLQSRRSCTFRRPGTP